MWKSFILLLFASTAYSESLSNNSYNGVAIGVAESEALKILKSFESTKDSYELGSTCYYLISNDANNSDVHFMILDGVVSRIDVVGNSKVSTKEGIRIGSTKDDVIKTYASVKVTPHPYIAPEGEYLEVKVDDKLGLIFETENDVVTRFRLGDQSIHFIEGCL